MNQDYLFLMFVGILSFSALVGKLIHLPTGVRAEDNKLNLTSYSEQNVQENRTSTSEPEETNHTSTDIVTFKGLIITTESPESITKYLSQAFNITPLF